MTNPALVNPIKSYMVYLLAVAIAFLLLIDILLIFENSRVIERNNQLQDQTERIKVTTLDILKTVHQMDMGMRGYALIKSDVQLKVVTDGYQEIDSIFALLETSLQDQKFDLAALKIMQDSTQKYLTVVRHMMTLVDAGELDAFKEILKKDLGLNTYLAHVTFSDKVNRFEDNIAREARGRYDLALRNSYMLQIGIFLLTVPALIYMTMLFKRTTRYSKELRAAERKNIEILETQKSELEKQVWTRTNEILVQNEEIKAQSEEIASHNEQLILQQSEIANHRNALEKKNEKLEEAYLTIERQNAIIQQKNAELTTEVIHQTEDLVKTNQQLIEHNGRLEQFAFIISHNLRAPIARLVGLSELLKVETNEAERDHLVQLMLKTTSDFDNIIKDLSKILSIQKSNTSVYAAVELDTIANKVLSALENEINAVKADIRKDFSAAKTIYSLPQYIESIFHNLLSNAIKYRNPDRMLIVKIKTDATDKTIRIIVSDNGLGLDLSQHKNAIFNLYKRFHFHVEGKGLGLYLVRTQVEALGGKIHLESEAGKGSTFIVEFPRQVSISL